MQIRPAEARDAEAVSRLFAMYQAEYRDALGDQDVAGEGRSALDRYAAGALLVADDGAIVGCVAYEPWGPGRVRMKRMYVPPQHRGRGVGLLLAQAIIDRARLDGHHTMVLDTSRPMEVATAIYRRLGFKEVDADWEAPCRDVIYMGRSL